MKVIGLIAGALLAGIVFTSIVWKKPIRLERNYVTAPNPLQMALDYGLSAECFAELVKKAPEWVNRISFAGKEEESVLSYVCTILFTNHVKILVEHNADVEQARGFLKKNGATEALELLEQVYSNYETNRGIVTNNIPSQ